MKKDGSFYKRLYSEILLGYTSVVLKDRVFYLKHQDSLDSMEQAKAYEINYQYAKSKGLEIESEKLDFIIKNGLWTQEEENKIAKLKEALERQEMTQKKLFVKAQKIQNQKKIDQTRHEITELVSKKNDLLGETCETFAAKKSQEEMLRTSFYKNKDLTEHYYSVEDFEDLTSSDISTLFLLMANAMKDFSEKNLKIISLCPFFLNSFFLCSDNAYNFFGVPVSRLSNNQISLYSMGSTIKDYASKGNPIPDNILEDPEKALSWFEFDPEASKHNSEKLGGTIVGATMEEMKQSDPNAVDVNTAGKEMFKDKKTLNMQDMLKLHGY